MIPVGGNQLLKKTSALTEDAANPGEAFPELGGSSTSTAEQLGSGGDMTRLGKAGENGPSSSLPNATCLGAALPSP